MQAMLIARLVLLLAIANGAPVLAKKLLGNLCAAPLDGGMSFFDGRPLFGTSKTLRGIVLSVLATPLGAPLVGLDWKVGTMTATGAMAGDLFSSFVKRRLSLPPSSMAIGLDQIPDADTADTLPAAAAAHRFRYRRRRDLVFYRRIDFIPPAVHGACSRTAVLIGRTSRQLQMMQRYFRRAVEPYRNHRRSGADRGISGHVMVFPGT
jgi:CDP-2,3-bis-(O-geranylgeranyl)-sn-glycerol synthase